MPRQRKRPTEERVVNPILHRNTSLREITDAKGSGYFYHSIKGPRGAQEVHPRLFEAKKSHIPYATRVGDIHVGKRGGKITHVFIDRRVKVGTPAHRKEVKPPDRSELLRRRRGN